MNNRYRNQHLAKKISNKSKLHQMKPLIYYFMHVLNSYNKIDFSEEDAMIAFEECYLSCIDPEYGFYVIPKVDMQVWIIYIHIINE